MLKLLNRNLVKTYISILRGINVGGKRKILMTDLKKLYTQLGFTDIVTYIQSGNVIFNSKEKNVPKLESSIKNKILEVFGYDVPVIIRSVAELKEIINNNPFKDIEGSTSEKLYITFLSKEPEERNEINLANYDLKGDEFKIVRKNVFICLKGKASDSKITNNLLEQKLKVTATTRNWKTTEKLLELASFKISN